MTEPTALLVDDEPLLRFHLKRQLAELWPELEIAAEASDGEEALALAEACAPTVIFLDIRMPGMDGLAAASELRRRGSEALLVFATAYDEYAVAAFEREAVDYLLKPIETERLAQSVARLQQRLASNSEPTPLEAIERLLEQVGDGGAPRERQLNWIRAQRGEAVHLLAVEEVLYFRAEDKYTSVITADGEYLIRSSIKSLVDQLDGERFWRVHRSTIVQVAAIASSHRDLAGNLHLKLRGRDEELPVSRAYAQLFKQM